MDAIASTQAVADWQQQYFDTLILMNEYVEAATIEIRTLAANIAVLGGMCNTRSLTFERTVRPGTCTVYIA